jgi:putative sigma-54 modulation protein
MKVRIQSVHFNADSTLLERIQEKVNKLVHFYDHIIGGDVLLKLDKSSDTQNKIVQIKLAIPGNDLITRHQCKTFEEATDLCVDTLSRQVKKHKEKQRGI